MSVVTAVVLLTDLSDDDNKLLAALNGFDFEGKRGLTHLTDQMGGTKHPQALVFGGGFNYLEHDAWLSFLRGFPWWDHGVTWAQVAMQGEWNAGFGLVEVYRAHSDADPAWSEEAP